MPRQAQTRKENMTMNAKPFYLLALALTLTTPLSTAHAFGLGDAAKLASAVSGENSTAAKSADLLGKLTALNVSPEQAAGGTSALLGLAKNKLAGADYTQIMDSVPALQNLGGSAVSGLLGQNTGPSNLNSLADVGSAFSALGMDSGMVSQFAPILLDFIGNQGVGQPLLGTLTSLWTGQ